MAPPIYNKDRIFNLPYEIRGTQQGMTSADFKQVQEKEQSNVKKNEAKKQKCLAKGPGWYWDEATGTCVQGQQPMKLDLKNVIDLSKPAPTTNAAPTPNKFGAEIPGKYDEAKGGYVTDDGKIFPTTNKEWVPTYSYEGVEMNKDGTVSVRKGDVVKTMSKEEYDNYVDLLSGRGGNESNIAKELMALPDEKAFNVQKQQARMQELMRLAEQGLLTPQEIQAIQGANPNIAQALGAGLSSVIPGLVGGAAAGAAGGALVGGVGAIPGAVIGGAAGALGTFLNGVKGNIKSQQSGEFAADQTALSRGQTMLRSLITDTNQNPQNAAENIQLFYKTLNMIDAAHARTYKDSQEDLNKFLGNDGTEQLAKFEVFNATMRQYYINRFEASLLQPDATMNLINEEDLEQE